MFANAYAPVAPSTLAPNFKLEKNVTVAQYQIRRLPDRQDKRHWFETTKPLNRGAESKRPSKWKRRFERAWQFELADHNKGGQAASQALVLIRIAP